jgi:hypothetical protein
MHRFSSFLDLSIAAVSSPNPAAVIIFTPKWQM